MKTPTRYDVGFYLKHKLYGPIENYLKLGPSVNSGNYRVPLLILASIGIPFNQPWELNGPINQPLL